MSAAPSGEQHEIAYADQRAVVVEVGGGIRAYRHGDRDVLESYPVDALCDAAHGAPLLPWPNRVGEGRYSFDGRELQLDVSEPASGCAIHGLTRWRSWTALERAADRVVMGTALHPSPGYPFTLDLKIAYRLDRDGLTVTTTATNLGGQAAPFGSGQHPYLSPGDGSIDTALFECPAATHLLTDGSSHLPVGSEPVDGTRFDFRSPRSLDAIVLDDPFGDLARGSDGRARIRLTGNDQRTVELWIDEGYQFVQLYSADHGPGGRQRSALAVEPMTCPPDALRSGDHLARLEPGQQVTTRWGVALLR